MTLENSQRVRTVAQLITDASAPEVRAEINALKQSNKRPAWVKEAGKAMEVRFGRNRATRGPLEPTTEGVAVGPAPIGADETIVFAVGTPVFLVKNNSIDISSARVEANAWRQILTANALALNRAMVSIGRVDAENFDNEFVGTAWVIDDGLVVTNRHVANLFAEASGTGFKFKLGFNARTPIGVKVDFLEELGNSASDEVRVERVVWVAPDSGPDVAFLKLEQKSSPIGRLKLELSEENPRAKMPVAVIGYPASDIRFSDQELANKIFGGVYNKKRVAVGNLLAVGDDLITHSCSTLGGNSGSPVIDIGTGKVVGLHYRGIEFIENDAVPLALLRRCLTRARGLVEAPRRTEMGDFDNVGSGNRRGGVTFTVPLRITVELECAGSQSTINVSPPADVSPAMTPDTRSRPSAPNEGEKPDKERTLAAVGKARTLLANREDVVAIKAGYRFENGEITNQRAVVIAVKRKVEMGALESRGVVALPAHIDGVRTDITVATTADLLGVEAADEAAAPNWHTTYVARPTLPLDRRTAKMKFVIHSGPDASWQELKPFLSKTAESLVIAMYDFGAVNVADGVLDAVKGKSEKISLVLQMGGKVHDGDLTDQEAVAQIQAKKGAKFDFAAASIGKNGIFHNAYHIKVAVRDHSAMWLSSGNWQVSNQPDIDPLNNADDAKVALRQYNREWHAILENKNLSELYEKHILLDLKEAKASQEGAQGEELLVLVPADMTSDTLEAAVKPRYFAPIRGNRSIDIQPILTPDNYIDVVVPFIQSAKRTLYLQNQSFYTKPVGGKYGQLLDALLAKQEAGLDVRIIFRSFGPDDRDTISNAKDYGFDTTRIRKQKNCHTKGIIVDGEAVLMGSHNWTTAGTGFNRDASLIFYDQEIAKFYEELFLYDWSRIGPAKIDESLPGPILVASGTEAVPPPGYIAVPLSTILGR